MRLSTSATLLLLSPLLLLSGSHVGGVLATRVSEDVASSGKGGRIKVVAPQHLTARFTTDGSASSSSRAHLPCPTLQCTFGCGSSSPAVDKTATAAEYLDWLLDISSPTVNNRSWNPPLPKQALTNGLVFCPSGNESLRAVHGVDIEAAAYAQIAFASQFAVSEDKTNVAAVRAQLNRMSEFYLREYVHTPAGKYPLGNNLQPLRATGGSWDYNGKQMTSWADGYLFNNWANKTSYKEVGDGSGGGTEVVYPVGAPTLRATALVSLALLQSWNLELERSSEYHHENSGSGGGGSTEGGGKASAYEQRMLAMRTTISDALSFATTLYTTTLSAMQEGFLFFESPVRFDPGYDSARWGASTTSANVVSTATAVADSEDDLLKRRKAAMRSTYQAFVRVRGMGKTLSELRQAIEEIKAEEAGGEEGNRPREEAVTDVTSHAPFVPMGPTVGPATATPANTTTEAPPTPVPTTTAVPPTPSPTSAPFPGVVVLASQFILYGLTNSLDQLYAQIPEAGYSNAFVEALTSANNTLELGVFYTMEFMAVDDGRNQSNFVLSAKPRFGPAAVAGVKSISVYFFPVAVTIKYDIPVNPVRNPSLRSDQCSDGGAQISHADPCSPYTFDVETQLLALATFGWKLNSLEEFFGDPSSSGSGSSSSSSPEYNYALSLMQVVLAAGAVEGSSPTGAALGHGIQRNHTSPYLINLAIIVTQFLTDSLPPAMDAGPLWNNNTQRHDAILETLHDMKQALQSESSLQSRQCRLSNATSSSQAQQRRAIYGTLEGEKGDCDGEAFPVTLDTSMAVLGAGLQNPFMLFQYTLPTPQPPATTTAVPPTPMPPSPVPPTPMPPSTLSPPTPAPRTPLPPTPKPQTESPPTPEPAITTNVPPTPVPETTTSAPPSTTDAPNHSKRQTPRPFPQTNGPKAPGPPHHSGATTGIIAIGVVSFCGVVAGSLFAYQRYKIRKEEELLQAPTENLGFY